MTARYRQRIATRHPHTTSTGTGIYQMLTYLQSPSRLLECAAADPDLRRKGRLLNALFLGFTALELINMVYTLLVQKIAIEAVDVVAFFSFLALYAATRRGHVLIAAWTIILFSLVLIAYFAVNVPPDHPMTEISTLALLMVPIVLTGVFLPWWAAFLVTAVSCLFTFWVYVVGGSGHAAYNQAHSEELSMALFILELSLIAGGLLAGTSGRLIESALDDLRQRNRDLEGANRELASQERLRSELDIARSIQRRLLPAQVPQLAAIEIAAECRPALETSGDSYDLLVGDDGSLHVVVLDACGKSVPAALLTALSRNPLRAALARTGSPAAALTETNGLLTPDLLRHQFVAACCLTVAPDARGMRIANAGQVYPLLARRHAANGQGIASFVESPSPRLPLGIVGEGIYREISVPLEPGDMIVCCSDGVVDAARHGGEAFGFDRLSALVCESVTAGHDADQTLAVLLDTLQNWADSSAPQDDLTAIVLRVR
jgi:serine phosphatase RsbU (regulator of sigma subunit)